MRLFLNGNLQFHSRDEYRYHEALVHPALSAHGAPKKVLVLGGGDGMAVREVLKYASVERVTLVELDPHMTRLFSTAPLLRDLADELAECGEATALLARLDAVLARLACHGSIRAGRRLKQAEMDALLRQMEQTPRAATCPHGRPTVLKLSRAEIEKLFGRR